MAPHLLRAQSAYKDIRIHSFHHTHTHTHTHTQQCVEGGGGHMRFPDHLITVVALEGVLSDEASQVVSIGKGCGCLQKFLSQHPIVCFVKNRPLKIADMAVGAAISCLAVRVYDVMNKADVCGTGVHHVTSQLFLLFIFERVNQHGCALRNSRFRNTDRTSKRSLQMKICVPFLQFQACVEM